jgi:hypothetical protein
VPFVKTVLNYRDGDALPDIPNRSALSVLLLACSLLPAEAWGAEQTGFDATTLHQRGIDPQLASLLLDAPARGEPAGQRPAQGALGSRFRSTRPTLL